MVAVEQRMPYGIAVGRDGKIWFGELAYRAIGRISMQGTIQELPLPADATSTMDVVAGSDGNMWFTQSNGVARITPDGAVKLFPLEKKHGPYALTSGKDGAIWFTEMLANRIGRISMAGDVTEVEIQGKGRYPRGIAVGPDGAIWFTHSEEIGRLARDRKLSLYTLPSVDDLSEDICVDPNGNIWFSVWNYTYSHWIGRMTPRGQIAKYPFTDDVFPMGLTIGPDGNVWFTEYGSSEIGEMSETGQLTEFKLPRAKSYPATFVSGPDGNLWFTEEGRDTIGRITLEGKITEFPIPGGIGEEP
jgi:virginiamycin B lyase